LTSAIHFVDFFTAEPANSGVLALPAVRIFTSQALETPVKKEGIP
jgi:hypothetical protein